MSLTLSPETQLNSLTSFWQLVLFRVVVVAILLLLCVTAWLLEYPVTAWSSTALVLITLLATNLALPLLPQRWQASAAVLVIGICLDFLAIFALLLLSGGVSNGFVALLLLPVAVSAVLLSAWVSYLFAIAAIVGYGVLLWLGDLTRLLHPETLLQQHVLQPHHLKPFSQHMWQMWCAFIISAILISWFISRQTRLIRQKSEQLSHLQQNQLRQEKALAIATYAANAAHDLATPIQNLLLLTDEVATELAQHPALPDIQQQLTRCQHIIENLRKSAGDWRNLSAAELYPVLLNSLQSWAVTRPELQITLRESTDNSHCRIQEATAAASAIFQILDNAAEASMNHPHPQLTLVLNLTQQHLTLKIIDSGAGLSEQRLAELGHYPLQSEQGLGWGQFLANISIERLGGEVRRRNLPEGGMETQIMFKDQAV